MVNGFQCDNCQGYLKPNELKDKKCPKDAGSVHAAWFCDKTGFGCASCGTSARKQESCRGCKKSMQPVADRTAVNYLCTKCDTSDGTAPGNCKKCGKKLKAKCAKDGKFPHGGESKNCK